MKIFKAYFPAFALGLILCAGCSSTKPAGAHVAFSSPALRNWWNQPPPQPGNYKDDFGLVELIRNIVYWSK